MSTNHLPRLGLVGIILFALGPFAGAQQPPPGGGNVFRGGGDGNFRFDPGMFFDRIANGRQTIPISEVPSRDPDGSQRLQQWATQNGITNGQLDRQQFSRYMEERMAERRARFGSGGAQGAPNARGAATPGGTAAPAAPSAGGAEPTPDGNMVIMPSSPGALEEEEKRPTVHRPGKLPKGLPDWFAKLDTDGDGQVGLYEWKAAGRSLDEFRKLDRNGDGFITVEEALRSVKPSGAVAGGSTPRPSDDSAEESSSNRQASFAAPTNRSDGSRADRPRRSSGGNRWNNGQGSRRGYGRPPASGQGAPGGGGQSGGPGESDDN